jgi:hypothetical protein
MSNIRITHYTENGARITAEFGRVGFTVEGWETEFSDNFGDKYLCGCGVGFFGFEAAIVEVAKVSPEEAERIFYEIGERATATYYDF